MSTVIKITRPRAEHPNPIETQNALSNWHAWKSKMAQVLADIDAAIPAELLKARSDIEANIARWEENCKTAAEKYGGYVGNIGECYWQPKDYKTYNVGQFRERFPELARLCVVDAIDLDKLKGLLKGKFLTEEELEPCIIHNIKPAFILR